MDLALDDVIKKQRSSKGSRGGGRGRGARGTGFRGGRGAMRRSGGRGGAGFGGRSSFGGSGGGVPSGAWQHDRFGENGFGGGRSFGLRSAGSLNAQTKLLVGNLDFAVSDADIQELFGEFGPVRRATVHYDASGRSLGSAEVVYERRVDATRALKQYNEVPLDGRPMKISIVGPGANAMALAQAQMDNRVGGGGGASGGGSRPRGGGGRPRGRGRGAAGGRTKEKEPQKSAEDLDKELDAYINKMD